ELEPENLRVRLKLGDLLLRARRAKEALVEAEAVLSADSENPPALDIKGRALRDLRRYDEAQAVAEQLLSKDPNNLGSAFLKVTIAEARRDFAAAAGELERLLKRPRRPENAEKDARDDRTLLIHLGAAYQRLDRQREAADTFARAKATGGEPDAMLLAHYVEALILAKDTDRALTEVRAARKRFADDEDLIALEANLLDDGGDKAGARALMDGLRTKSPEDVGVLLRVAQFHQRAKRFGDAETVLRQARELEPRNQNALFVLGAVLERQKRFDAAESVFREALAVQPEFAPALNYLGYMNADRKVKLAEAVTLIEKAVALDPENGAYLDSLGWALFRQGRLAEAEDYLRRAVVKETGAVVLDHLGDVLGRQGKTAEAIEYWNRALRGEDEDGELDRARVA
ncbi:MAG TPA: tetratricopeptide repeat protein, partial [Vicinamibacteria bacterium]|nr:tetratricopeptide repeat protein [Vicinamibacteria bacterium]